MNWTLPKDMPDTATVTGTRRGWSRPQRDTFAALATGQHPSLLLDGAPWRPVPLRRIRHGQCVGVDAQAHNLILELLPGCEICRHPQSRRPEAVASLEGGICLPPDPDPQRRNRAMVRREPMVIGVPVGKPMARRGGTPGTIMYALACHRLVVVIWPDGTVEPEPAGLVTKIRR